MSKQTIKFQPVYPDPPVKGNARFKGKKLKPNPKDVPQKIYLDNQAVGFIRLNPHITVHIRGVQIPGKIVTLASAKALAINYIAQNLK